MSNQAIYIAFLAKVEGEQKIKAPALPELLYNKTE